MWALAHVGAAVVALVAGLVVLRARKGSRGHRVVGTIYGLALVLVNAAALSLHRENAFGVFHALAVVSLCTLVVGLVPLLLGRRSAQVIVTHAYCMTWSYAGLVAAGCGQLVAALADDVLPGAVPVMIGAVLVISGLVIVRRVPPTLDRVLAR